MSKSNTCKWVLEDIITGVWKTSCKNSFVFRDDGGPQGYEFVYCPFCGKHLVSIVVQKEYER